MRRFRSARWFLLALVLALFPVSRAHAGVFISVGFAPPALPVYVQPPCPEPNMIWVPGYWAYGDDGYYWVPGAWVPAPYEGALWTPPYWGWSGGAYVFHTGYWGPVVGYYGGINYGFGYFGLGFVGGRWHDNDFEYNTAVWHVDRDRVHRIYEDRDWHDHYVDRDSHVAYSGGPGGIRHDPDRDERRYMNEQHFQRTSFQDQHVNSAMRDRNAYYNVNHGRPQRIVANRPLAQDNRPAPMPRDTFNNNRQSNPPQNPGRNGYQQPNRGGQSQPYQGDRNNPQARPQQPQYRPQPEYRTVPPQMQHQQPQNQQQQPEYRQPQQQNRQPEYRPAPQQRPQPQPEYRPQQPQYRPQPQQRPQQQPQYRPQPQQRPQQERPQPQQRPENRGNGGEGQQQQHEDHGRGR